MDYIMGLSGAGSVTNVNIATITGFVVQSFTVGAISFFFARESEVEHNLAEAFVTAQMAGYPIKHCRQVCAGVAGLQPRQATLGQDPKLRLVMRRCGYSGDALLCDDEQIALAGALEGKKGAILLADDTSACYGQMAGGFSHRTGCMGTLADDDGSAYAVGREILRAVARASDGRGPSTRLISLVYQTFSLGGPADFIRLLRQNEPTAKQICGLAGGLAQACQSRDQVAMDIVDITAGQLLRMVTPVVEKLRMEKGTLAVAGRILLDNSYVGAAFKQKISQKYPELNCVPPRGDGASGAVLLAKERLALRGNCHS